jgi:hypothetical protein
MIIIPLIIIIIRYDPLTARTAGGPGLSGSSCPAPGSNRSVSVHYRYASMTTSVSVYHSQLVLQEGQAVPGRHVQAPEVAARPPPLVGRLPGHAHGG